MSTSPGFSSRSQATVTSQFPQRDGAAVTEIAGMETAGWSNSEPVDSAPSDVHPEVAPPPDHEPGFSNGEKVDEQPAPEPVEHAIVTPEPAQEAPAPTADEPTGEPAKKTTARKSSARKKG